jgi:putative ABC transport system permease protein
VIDLDRWREIGEALARNPVRTMLTMGSVAWGTFVLVVLLGAGRGLENSVLWEFRDDAMNSVWVYRGKTSKPFAGNPVGRSIRMTNRDYEAVRDHVDGIEHITARFYLRGESEVTYGERSAAYSVRSVHPDHQYLEQTIITHGRYLNELDLSEKRKVAVIGRRVAEYLFRGRDPLGEYVGLSSVPFRVIGVFDDVGGEGEVEQIYVPISTAQATFGGYDQVNQIMFTLPNATPESGAALLV